MQQSAAFEGGNLRFRESEDLAQSGCINLHAAHMAMGRLILGIDGRSQGLGRSQMQAAQLDRSASLNAEMIEQNLSRGVGHGGYEPCASEKFRPAHNSKRRGPKHPTPNTPSNHP